MKKTNEMTAEQLVAIKNNEVFRVKYENIVLEGKISFLIDFARNHGLSVTKLQDIIFDNDIITEDVPEETSEETVLLVEKDHKGACELYNKTEGSDKFEKHAKSKKGDNPKVDYATRLKYANNRQNERTVASNTLSDLRKERTITRVAKRRQTARIIDVIYVPENTFDESEAKKTKTSRLMILIKTDSGRTNLVNIANIFHQQVGRCSKKRIAALLKVVTESTVTVELNNKDVDKALLYAWFQDAGLPVKNY